jgi:hypothetical protein
MHLDDLPSLLGEIEFEAGRTSVKLVRQGEARPAARAPSPREATPPREKSATPREEAA